MITSSDFKEMSNKRIRGQQCAHAQIQASIVQFTETIHVKKLNQTKNVNNPVFSSRIIEAQAQHEQRQAISEPTVAGALKLHLFLQQGSTTYQKWKELARAGVDNLLTCNFVVPIAFLVKRQAKLDAFYRFGIQFAPFHIWNVGKGTLSKDMEVIAVAGMCPIERAQTNKLYFKLKKRQFARAQVPFRGHLPSTAGVSVDPSQISALPDLIAPLSSEKQIQAFLGLCNSRCPKTWK
jgi:hypothetical protein